MGKKIHSKIVVQNNKKIENNLWNINYSEKRTQELPLYVFLTLEIKKFITMFLKKNGLTLHNYKINFSESDLKIFISYFRAPIIKIKFNPLGSQDNDENSMSLINNHKKQIQRLNNCHTSLNNKIQLLSHYYNSILQEKLKVKRYKNHGNSLANHHFQILKSKSISDNNAIIAKNNGVSISKKLFLSLYNVQDNSMELKTSTIHNFLESIIESFNIFLKTKFNISITLHQINNDLKYLLTAQQIQILKKISMQLRRYQEYKFFAEGINLLVLALLNKNVSELLAQFISTHFKAKKKEDNIFFKFLKQVLSLLFANQVSKIKSVKILIKGRFNGSRRTRKKLIFVGNNMPLMTLNSNIGYSESTSYGPNGTFGIKVWVNER